MSKRIVSLVVVFFAVPVCATAQEPLTFETHVRPILKAHCFECHGDAQKPKGGLDLRLQRLIAAGGKSGPAVIPGKTKDSLLLERVRTQEMPPGKRKLTKDEIAVIERWIAQGTKTEFPEPKALAAGFHITAKEQ